MIRDLDRWSFPAGRLLGVRIRIHWLFPVFAAGLTLMALRRGGWFDAGVLGLTLVISYLFILLHELGHCRAASRAGLPAYQILLWPFGGLAYVGGDARGPAEVKIALAGPLVSLAVSLVLAAAVLVMGPGGGESLARLNPLDLYGVSRDSFLGALVVWLYRYSAWLFLFNLIPAFPMDMGRVLRGLLHPRVGPAASTVYVCYLALALAGAGIAVGLFLDQFLLLLIAAMILANALQLLAATARQAPAGEEWRRESEAPGPARPGWLARWRGRWRRRRQARRQAAVDRVLDKIHREGIGALTAGEKRLLDRTARELASRRPGDGPRPPGAG